MLVLRQADVEELRNIQRRVKFLMERFSEKPFIGERYLQNEDGIQSPDRYIFLSPPTGISPLFRGVNQGTGSDATGDDIAGKAKCEAYRLEDDGSLKKLGIKLLVYNLSGLPILPGRWFLASRDKFGYWIADNPGYDFLPCDSGTGS